MSPLRLSHRWRRWRLLALLPLLGVAARASEAVDAVKHADVARVRATIAGNANELAALLSNGLIYGHADGRVQTKAEFIAAVISNQMKYEAYDYGPTQLVETAPGVVTMSGLARIKASAANQHVAFTLRFLAVWRNEGGQWRLFAYQSATVPPPAK